MGGLHRLRAIKVGLQSFRSKGFEVWALSSLYPQAP